MSLYCTSGWLHIFTRITLWKCSYSNMVSEAALLKMHRELNFWQFLFPFSWMKMWSPREVYVKILQENILPRVKFLMLLKMELCHGPSGQLLIISTLTCFALHLFQDTHKENAPSNKTQTLQKSMYMDIWAVGALN